jgi:hypothetical protein
VLNPPPESNKSPICALQWHPRYFSPIRVAFLRVLGLPRSHRLSQSSPYLLKTQKSKQNTPPAVTIHELVLEEREREMLKVSCNVTMDQIALAQCGFLGRPMPLPAFTPRRKAAVSGRPLSKAPVLAVVSDRGGLGRAIVSGSGSLADRLRLGSLTEDGLSYKERFVVRCYEVGINKTATVETIANLLQVQNRTRKFIF